MTEDFERNKDGSIMTKETLSDKITTIARLDWIRDKDAKEKIQNAQRRIL